MRPKLIVPALILTLLAGIYIGHSKINEQSQEVFSFNFLTSAFKETQTANKVAAMTNINDQILILKAEVGLLKEELSRATGKQIASITPDILEKMENQVNEEPISEDPANVKPTNEKPVNEEPVKKEPAKKPVTENKKPPEDIKEIPIEEIKQKPQKAQIIQKNTYVNMRSGPSEKYDIITKIYPDQEFSIVTKQNSWYQIKLQDGKTGWVASWIVKVKSE
ncbi:SH3 domain-containing protein [Desulfonispora thiosulfatigenes DSM 11270]|uniref:SH3 domain-containing protein n=1 Tax=Desulfonispora thiosulfatigenes DSM 11270 TaxID=656914 RepID=A0A1W1V5C0_DESTI|nr:SH3 domain-containing protein [Desulfonispora thiosulfatigenes]SMB88493.1 SH3 domain-containing protein [Desulfonispora thiosulfatigenes DSM 11270]